jgi:hypothetical protein
MPDGVAIAQPTFRLIPSQYPPVGAFDDVSSPDDLAAVMELEGWTNDRLVEVRLNRLPRAQWVYGRPNASIIMAAFLHGAPDGNRFSGPDLNAWYASLALKTAIAEVANHLRRQMINEGRQSDKMTFRSYGARLHGDNYIDIRGSQADRPDLYDRRSFAASQPFGGAQRAAGRDGIIYDSLRHAGGANIVCFVPTHVLDVTQQEHFEIQVYADPKRKPIVIRLST